MISRRQALLASLAVPLSKVAMAQTKPSGKMTLSIHQNTSRAAGYRKSLEGWAKAGIKFVEVTDVLLDDFLTGERTLRSDVLDRLVDVLGYELQKHSPQSGDGV